jgi:hypothetical protein
LVAPQPAAHSQRERWAGGQQPEGARVGGMAPMRGWCSTLIEGQAEHQLRANAGVGQRRRGFTQFVDLQACEVFAMFEASEVTSGAEVEATE